MAETPDRDQQTEAPTSKRRMDAANEGDVLMSRELASALMMLAGVIWLVFVGQWLVEAALEVLRHGLVVNHQSTEIFDPLTHGWQSTKPILLPAASLFAASLVAAIAGPALLGSIGWRSKAFGPKANRLNPLSGLKRIFGMQGLIELTKALAKAVLLGSISWWLISKELDRLLGLAAVDTALAARQLGTSLVDILMALAIGMVLIALLDVPAQMFQRTRRLRMTRQQLKEELRQNEGAPELKAFIRARQQTILSQSARKAMVDANVVLNNPAHFSVALRYRPGIDNAPTVVARGRDEVALAMRELAAEREVPMLDQPRLARAIYFSTRAGQAIPEDLYHAVAIIMAFIFRLDRQLAEEQSLPKVDVPPSHRFDADGNPESG